MNVAQEIREREKLINEAKTWLGTPYHSEARVKGAGVDCGMFLLQSIENVGLLPHTEIPHYPVDIACHCAVPRYLMKIQEYCDKVEDGTRKAGDILVFKFKGSKVPHHAGFVVDKDYMIHAYTRLGVILSNTKGYEAHLYGVYRLKRWCS